MNFNKLCKPFLIYIVFSIIIAIYQFTSQAYENINKITLKSIKLNQKHNEYVNKLFPDNVNMNKILKHRLKHPNYIYTYLSSNLLMFVILFVLCEFNHMNAAWIILSISIVFQVIVTYFMSHIFDEYGDLILKEMKKNK
jgi:hypothetical protein